MSRLTDLIRQAKQRDPQLGADLELEFKVLSGRRAFGLNFERHRPETVELPQRTARRGDKVRVLPKRGSTSRGDQRLWRVAKIEKVNGGRVAHVELIDAAEPETQTVLADDLVVVAEFKDLIYPGLVSTGKVEQGEGKPFHTVINGENYHVLEMLTYTHRGKIDAIYIDPPYNTGARDWKYNNDYVEGDDLYRHSKWLAFMERRLRVAKQLLNPADSVLIVTVDEKEYLRLGMLLEQRFPEADIQMVSSVINTSGAVRANGFARVDEYIFIAFIGLARVIRNSQDMLTERPEAKTPTIWRNLIRDSGSTNRREDRWRQFYPIFVDINERKIVGSAGPLPLSVSRVTIQPPSGTVAVFPLRINGIEGYWQLGQETFEEYRQQGYVKVGQIRGDRISLNYLRGGDVRRVRDGEIKALGRAPTGELILETDSFSRPQVPKSVWNLPSHNAPIHGSGLLRAILPQRRFPYPKALYAVEDVLRFFVANKPQAMILDFFAGSGTTAHAVMRLNHQDDGKRQCILVTNNEVSADEQEKLRADGFRPGDADWEQWGICDYITKPRIEAVITGKTPNGEPINGDYKFTEEFPIADGFRENAEFFTLTYESPVMIGHNKAFARIAPLLWMRAGSQGRRINAIPEDGWDVADTYGILFDLDHTTPFCHAVGKAEGLRVLYIVTNDDRRFQAVARRLPDSVESIRLYESYLTNFRFSAGD